MLGDRGGGIRRDWWYGSFAASGQQVPNTFSARRGPSTLALILANAVSRAVEVSRVVLGTLPMGSVGIGMASPPQSMDIRRRHCRDPYRLPRRRS